MSLATNKPATSAKQDIAIQALTDILGKIIAAPATDAKVEAVRALLAGTLTVAQAGFDSAGGSLPAGFDTYAKAVTQTWDATTGLPLIRTEVVTVGANTYTRTTTNTLTGSNITGTTVSRWVKA